MSTVDAHDGTAPPDEQPKKATTPTSGQAPKRPSLEIYRPPGTRGASSGKGDSPSESPDVPLQPSSPPPNPVTQHAVVHAKNSAGSAQVSKSTKSHPTTNQTNSIRSSEDATPTRLAGGGLIENADKRVTKTQKAPAHKAKAGEQNTAKVAVVQQQHATEKTNNEQKKDKAGKGGEQTRGRHERSARENGTEHNKPKTPVATRKSVVGNTKPTQTSMHRPQTNHQHVDETKKVNHESANGHSFGNNMPPVKARSKSATPTKPLTAAETALINRAAEAPAASGLNVTALPFIPAYNRDMQQLTAAPTGLLLPQLLPPAHLAALNAPASTAAVVVKKKLLTEAEWLENEKILAKLNVAELDTYVKISRAAALLINAGDDVSAATAFHTALVGELWQYYECRESLRAQHFSYWLAYVTFLSDMYATIGFTYEGELVNVLLRTFTFMLRPPVLETLRIEELEALISALLACGYDLERQCPDELVALRDCIRDAFVAAHEPWARKMILLLIELAASGWRLPAPANEYYFQTGNGTVDSSTTPGAQPLPSAAQG